MKYLLLLLLPVMAFASEGDAFSARLYQYSEMGPNLSLEVNKRLQHAVGVANKKAHSCEQSVILKAMEKELLRPVVGVFEYWSSHTDKVQGHYVKYADSIYRDLKFKENWPVHLGKFGMATFFKINGTLVASDKFGHFFDEGHTYYKMVKSGKTIQEAMEKGVELEKGIYGYKRSKIFSYGDLVANRSGYEFWKNLFENEDNNNYITCENNTFKLSRTFSFNDYVDDGWDEAINCSKYENRSVEDRVMKVISELELKSGKKLACPSERNKCKKLIEKHQSDRDFLISPTCY